MLLQNRRKQEALPRGIEETRGNYGLIRHWAAQQLWYQL
jgi:hypothetical protein